MKGVATMKKQRVSSQSIALDIGMDHRQLTLWFKRAKEEIMANDTEIEIEHFGIFGRRTEIARHHRWKWDISRHDQRDVIKMRGFRNPAVSVKEFRHPSAELIFRFSSVDGWAIFKLNFTDGLLLESHSFQNPIRERDNPMQQQRMGLGSDGPRIFGQYTHNLYGQEKVNFIYFPEINGWRQHEPQASAPNIEVRLELVSGYGWNEALGAAIPYQIDPNIYHNSINKSGSGSLENGRLFAMINFMCRHRTNANNTGPFWEEDLI